MGHDRSAAINQWLAVWEVNARYARETAQGEGQRAWAATALHALDQAESAGLGKADADVSRFHLRAYMILALGTDDEPLWNPDVLGADILAALPLDRVQAETWSTDWRERPASEILLLRRCKNLLNSARTIRDHLTDQVTASEIDRWLALWERLP
ncbi:hypothetical protein ACFXJ8_41385 [Nonomuraea sp. NPDC059194]|uniref:hypothetical protein n=1 Tax=Nonomuraea sp. NPDC059194 TaxID=3346764 RepID=UPI0036C0EF15